MPMPVLNTVTPQLLSTSSSSSITALGTNLGTPGWTINLRKSSDDSLIQATLGYAILNATDILITVATTGIVVGTVYYFEIDGNAFKGALQTMTGSGFTPESVAKLTKVKSAGGGTSFVIDNATADDNQQSTALGASQLGKDSVSLHITTTAKTGTPTNIKLYIDSSPDESTWFKHVDPDDVELAYLTMTQFNVNDRRAVRFPLRSATWRIRLVNDTANPTNNNATFDIYVEKHIPNARKAI